MTQKIQIGDYVRSFDFPHRGKEIEGDRACYVEGLVCGTVFLEGCERYLIRVERRVWGGDECPVEVGEEYVNPPINGIPMTFSDSLTDGVEVIR